MKKMLWTGLAAAVILTGCGAEETAQNNAEELVSAEGTLEMVVVDITTDKTAEPGDEVFLTAEIMQGTEAVKDADEVMFEVWESGYREQAQKLEGLHTENGSYETSIVFEEEGYYFIQAHTSARGLHVMPQQEITVGSPDPEAIATDDSEAGSSMENMESHSTN